MRDDYERTRDFGEKIAKALEGVADEERENYQKEALLSLFSKRKEKPRVLRYAAIIAAAIAAAAVILFLFFRNEQPAQLWIGDAVTVNKEGVWIQAEVEKPLELSFKDGSRMKLDSSARGQILEANSKKVDVVLHKGKLEASVRKNTGTRWTIMAGPYTVKVTGTEFSVSWDEGKTLFDVFVSQGSVHVSGSGLDRDGVELAAGDRLTINRKQGLIAIKPDNVKEKVPAPTLPAEPLQAEAPVEQQPACPGDNDLQDKLVEEGREPIEESTGRAKQVIEATAWKKLAGQGKYSEALEAAEKQGFDYLLTSLQLADLWQLADAARYAGDGGKAKRAFLAIRKRFKKTKQAKLATFLLGRVAIEFNDNPKEGAHWFQVYLKENPGGPLVEEAMGRLIDASLKSGKRQQAEKAAQQYLEKYNEGMFYDLAKETLKQ